jgi:hypothetical protein
MDNTAVKQQKTITNTSLLLKNTKNLEEMQARLCNKMQI